ncbi:hypothetical protein [Nocardia colli]|uniref:hypothetical protein n=1 Tax=Nocardia colli TaxID=2545717 RepID=UPI0035DE835C
MLVRKLIAGAAVVVAAVGAMLGSTVVEAGASPGIAAYQQNSPQSILHVRAGDSALVEPKFIDAPPPDLFHSKQECENWIYWRMFTHPWETWRCTEIGPNGVTALNEMA